MPCYHLGTLVEKHTKRESPRPTSLKEEGLSRDFQLGHLATELYILSSWNALLNGTCRQQQERGFLSLM